MRCGFFLEVFLLMMADLGNSTLPDLFLAESKKKNGDFGHHILSGRGEKGVIKVSFIHDLWFLNLSSSFIPVFLSLLENKKPSNQISPPPEAFVLRGLINP